MTANESEKALAILHLFVPRVREWVALQIVQESVSKNFLRDVCALSNKRYAEVQASRRRVRQSESMIVEVISE